MKKKTKAIIIISPIAIAFAVTISIIAYHLFFMPIYPYNRSTNTVQKDGVEYVLANDLPSAFLDNMGKTIGKIKGSNFESQERWVVKINGIDEHEMFLVPGLMNEELYVRKDKIDEFNKTLPQ